jgi:hypothetical protein
MPEEKALWILDQLAELKKRAGAVVFPMFYDEPTLHPGFRKIMKHQLEIGLIYDEWWFSTNGYGLARMPDSDWKELAEAGFDSIRLTFHGTGVSHDRLVRRTGAYEDLVKTIRKAEEHNVSWLAGMMLSAENQSMYEKTRDAVENLGTPCVDFGWMLPHSQGRALLGGNRVRAGQISRLLGGNQGWVTESEFVARILSDPEMGARSARSNDCGMVYLDIDDGLNVYYGGGCDGDPFGFMKKQVLLGNLERMSACACYDKYLNHPPEPVSILEGITWAELARKYGNTDNDEVFHFTSLIGSKWSEQYLREFYGSRGRSSASDRSMAQSH